MQMDNTSASGSVVYATLGDGVVLPVVDVTNPAFAVDDRESNLSMWREQIANPPVRSDQPIGASPAPPTSLLLQRMLTPPAGYLDGWATYVLKVGAENLPQRLDTELERRVLSSANAMSLRVRLQQLSRLMAESLSPGVESARLRVVSIGGGTGIEALNALIVLRKANSSILPPTDLVILDVDGQGSELGAAALASLRSPGGTLAGTDIDLRFAPYSWSQPEMISSILADDLNERPFTLVSSEGALFEYGSDSEVVSNLKFLREVGNFPVAGSAIRDDAAGEAMVARSPFRLHARAMRGIETLAYQAGYCVTRVVQGVATDQFLLAPA